MTFKLFGNTGIIPSSAIGSLAPAGATSSFAIAVSGTTVFLLSNADAKLFAIDASIPSAPVLLGSIATDIAPRDIVASGRFVYITGDTGVGRVIRAYDVSNPTTMVAGTSSASVGQSQGIAVQGKLVCGGDRGGQTKWYDFSDFNNPVLVVTSPSTFPAQGVEFFGKYTLSADSSGGKFYVYDTIANVVVSNSLTGFTSPRVVKAVGEYAYLLETTGTKLHVIRLGNLVSPTLVSSTTVTTAPNALAISGSYAYVGMTNSVEVYNVSVPSAPTLAGTITVTGIVRGLALQGNLLYVSSGSSPYLQIFKVGTASFEQLDIGGLLARQVNVLDTLTAGDAFFSGGLHIDQSGMFASDLSTGRNLAVAGDVNLQAYKFSYNLGGASLLLNPDGYNVDFNIAGDTDGYLLSIDAGLDRVGIGVPANSHAAKLHIHTATGSNPTFLMTDADVAHGMTALMPTTDSVRYLLNFSSTNGGTWDIGASSLGSVPGMAIQGASGATSVSVAPLLLNGSKKNTTNIQAVAATEGAIRFETGTIGSGTILGEFTGGGRLGLGGIHDTGILGRFHTHLAAGVSEWQFVDTDADVAHGMTSLLPSTDTIFAIGHWSGANGGAILYGANNTAGSGVGGLSLAGIIGASMSGSGGPGVRINGSKKNTTTHQAMAAGEIVFQVETGILGSATNLLQIDGANTWNFGTLASAWTLPGSTNALNISSSALVVDSTNKRVAIGGVSNAPAEALYVRQDGAGQRGIRVENNTTSGSAIVTLINATTSTAGLEIFGTTAAGTIFGQAKAGMAAFYASGAGSTGLALGTTTSDPIYVGTNDTLAIAVDTSQKVGIGTSSINSFLDIYTAVDGYGNQLTLNNGSAASTALAGASIDMRLSTTTARSIIAARMAVGKEQTWTGTASTQDGYLSFYTATDGILTEKVKLSSDGNATFTGSLVAPSALFSNASALLTVRTPGQAIFIADASLSQISLDSTATATARLSYIRDFTAANATLWSTYSNGVRIGYGRSSTATLNVDSYSPSTATTTPHVILQSSFTPSASSPSFTALQINPTINGTSSGTATALAIASRTNTLTGGTLYLADFGQTSTDYFTGYVSQFVLRARDGYVGIGTTNPNSFLNIATPIDGYGNQLTLTNSSTASTALAGAGMDMRLSTTTAQSIIAARIIASKEQTWTGTASTQDGYLAFFTAQDGILLEAGRFTSAGTLQLNLASGNAITVISGAGINFNSGGGVTLTAESNARLQSSAIIRSDSGYWQGGINSSWTSSGVTCAANSHQAWLRQTQTTIRDARLIGNTSGAGQVATQVGTSNTDALNGQAGTLFAVVTDAAAVTPVIKYRVDGYGNSNQDGYMLMSGVVAPNTLPSSLSNKVIFGVDTTKRNKLQASWDGYTYHDAVTALSKYKDADQTTITATLADDTVLNFGTIDANSRYTFEFILFASCPAVTDGIKVDLAGSLTVSNLAASVEIIDITTTALTKTGFLTSLGSGGVTTLTTAGDNYIVKITGSFTATTAGTFKLQIAQSAHTSGTTTFKRGSYAMMTKI